MTKNAFLCLCLTLLIPSWALAQQSRTLEILSTQSAPKIDGRLDESIWTGSPAATDFTEYSPQPGATEEEGAKNSVWIFHDQNALYIGAILWDSSKSILKEFTKRDDSGNSDYFSVLIDTYCDRINGYEFTVTSAGQQIDKRHSPTGKSSYKEGDETWDAVWHSAVKVEDDHWCVEIKIPFSAIRFSKAEEQEWGFNFMRYRRSTRKEMYWNARKPEISNFVSQWGTATGVNHVKPATLLSFSPYVSAFTEHFPQQGKNWNHSFSAGLDMKWGVSRAFTLDATLIPDFGQVPSDAVVNNLTPFEVEYNEKRPFFMEGTELFNKGDYFYSRRIGGRPVAHSSAGAHLQENEVISENPTETKMINAVKFSGRTKNGLGIGILNAITSQMFAIVEDTLSGQSHRVMTAPLSNYNVFVLDQSLKNNSYISLVNSSVIRAGSFYDSDVLGLLMRMNDSQNKFFLEAQGTGSFFSDRPSGYKYRVEAGKGRGNWQYKFEHELMDDRIDINDLGMQHENNRVSFEGEIEYQIFQPTSWYNRMNFGLDATVNNRFRTFGYETTELDFSGSIMLKDYTMISLGADFQPKGYDYYEPEKEGRFLMIPWLFSLNGMYSSNYANPFYCDVRLTYTKNGLFDNAGYNINVQPAFRFSPRFLIALTGAYTSTKDDVGCAWRNSASIGTPSDSVFMARRHIKEIEMRVDAKYAFNANMNITLAARHYVSKVENQGIYFLQQDGILQESRSTFGTGMIYNLFYLDCIYTWRFAPGSELNIVWKNQIAPARIAYNERSYGDDLKEIFSHRQRNNLSIKFIYYLDWNRL